MTNNNLPIVKKKKMIDEKKFTNLAKKVKSYWEKESKYLEGENGTSKTGKFIIFS